MSLSDVQFRGLRAAQDEVKERAAEGRPVRVVEAKEGIHASVHCSARMAACGSAGRAEGRKLVRRATACNANLPSARRPVSWATRAAKDQAVPAVAATEPRA